MVSLSLRKDENTFHRVVKERRKEIKKWKVCWFFTEPFCLGYKVEDVVKVNVCQIIERRVT